jgi:hypothetical protein
MTEARNRPDLDCGPGGLDELQRLDHARLDELMTFFEEGNAVPEDLWREFVRLTSTHAVAEEAVMLPAARDALGAEGDALTAEIEAKHQSINELLLSIEADRPPRPGDDERARRVFALIRADARKEEDVLLPRLAGTGVDLLALARTWALVAEVAPTRPHPHVSRRPPGNLLAAPLLSVFDRVRDRLARGRSWMP